MPDFRNVALSSIEQLCLSYMLKEDQSLNLTFQIEVTNISYNDLSFKKKKVFLKATEQL